MNKKNKKN